MSHSRYHKKITCAYLYTISKYGYPPDIRQTLRHIDEMADLGFTSIELEGIGEDNILYLQQHAAEIKNRISSRGLELPVLCLVLPQLSSADFSKHAHALELFEIGCALARELGAKAVLDNGPLLPLAYEDNAPIMRHYSEDHLASLGLPTDFLWVSYWEHLTHTYRRACEIAAKYELVYHLHPCEGSLITGTDSFINFANAVDSPHLMFNLDTANQYYFRDNLMLSLLRLSHRISYIHVSDNRGQKVEHQVPGDGEINWDSFFTALQEIKFSGNFAIDVGGDETGISDMEKAYTRSAQWLEEKLKHYSL